jgi:hypothetical protein
MTAIAIILIVWTAVLAIGAAWAAVSGRLREREAGEG